MIEPVMTPEAIRSDWFQFSRSLTSEGPRGRRAHISRGLHAFDNAHVIMARQIGFHGPRPLQEIALGEHGNERRRTGDSVDMTRARR